MPETAVGTVLTSADPEPPTGTIVLCLGEKWANHGHYWAALDRESGGETWRKVAGNYGPVTVLATPVLPRRCTAYGCDEFDGIHCYGDGCAMARNRD